MFPSPETISAKQEIVRGVRITVHKPPAVGMPVGHPSWPNLVSMNPIICRI